MLKLGPATKVTIHMNEDTSSQRDYLHTAIFGFLLAQGVSGASVIRPQAGFGSHHRTHSSGASGAEGQHLPVRIEFIESNDKVRELLPELYHLVTDGLIESQPTTILKVATWEEQI